MDLKTALQNFANATIELGKYDSMQKVAKQKTANLMAPYSNIGFLDIDQAIPIHESHKLELENQEHKIALEKMLAEASEQLETWLKPFNGKAIKFPINVNSSTEFHFVKIENGKVSLLEQTNR